MSKKKDSLLLAKNMARIESALRAASTLAGLEWGKDVDLDADPYLLGCRNGVVDLRTGLLRPGKREERITKNCGIAFDANAECPQFMQFMSGIFGEDQELVDFVQRAFGYTLTGSTEEQKMFLLVGSGANGKSVLLESLRRVAGEYATATPFSTFEVRRSEATNDVAALQGIRFVTASESEERAGLNEARVKSITGGDVVSARFLYGEFFSFKPVCKVWLATNSLPRVRGTDAGIWRRLLVIPFDVSFLGREDPHLLQKLTAESPGILNWAIRGCLSWHQDGLNPPRAVTERTESYRVDSDIVGQFIEQATEERDNARTPSQELYAAYRGWCEENGHKPISHTRFGKTLTERRTEKARSAGGNVYIGIELKRPALPFDVL